MVSGNYSFIDIAVLDQVRARLAAGDALAMLDVGLERLIWANGPGCGLFGYEDVESVMGAPSGLSPVARRQISAAPGFPRMRVETPVTARLAGSRPVGLLVSGITLPDGEPAVLLALPASHGSSRTPEEIARHAVSGFSDANSYAALIDETGRVEAASDGFAGLGIARQTLDSLVSEVRGEEDRLVKRLIPAEAATLAAGMARLTDDPARHLLLVIEAEEAALDPAETDQAAAPDDAVEDDPVPDAERVVPTVEMETVPEQGADAPRSDARAGVAETPAAPAGTFEPKSQGRDEAAAKAAESPQPSSAGTAASPERAGPASQLRNGAVRFVWRTDAEGRFTSVSDEFASAIGVDADQFTGRSFREIAAHFGLEGGSEVAELLERRDTWSGRTVTWPILGSGLGVPVDLAALPIHDRARNFEGFRGFGVARMGEAAPFSPREEQVEPAEAESVEIETEIDEDPFLGEAPAIAVERGFERRHSDKIIRLAEHRPANGARAEEAEPEDGLSASERSAFRQIGERLKRDSEAGPADDLKRGATTAAPQAGSEAPEPVSTAPQDEPPAAEKIPQPANEQDEQPRGETEEAPADGARAEIQPPLPHEDFPLSPAEPTPVAKLEDLKAVLARVDGNFRPAAYPGEVPSGGSSLTTLLGGLPLPVIVHAGDTLHFANREFFKLTGYDTLGDIVAGGGLDTLFVEGAEPSANSPTMRLRRADGGEIDVGGHLQSVAWNGGKALLLALRPTAEPAIEPKSSHNEDGLRARLEELRAIVDTATDGVVLIDEEGLIRSISRPAEALFGMDSRQVEGSSFTTLFAIESQRAAADYLAGLADNGVASVLNDGREVIGREAQGRFIPLFMTMGRLPAGGGYCAVLRDITHWKRAEEELTQARAQAERASSQKTEFLARVSHEVRTPLNAIIGFSELMLDEKFGPIGSDRYRDYLRDINRSGNHVLDLVNDLLDISKIEAGEQEMSYEAVSLNDSLAETVAMMQPQANRERVIIRSSFASRLPDVVADQRSVRQIALNLLSNAVRATPPGGQVIVSTAYEQSGDIVLRVRDTGIGMTIAEIEQALKPFKQINALKRARGEGTGLGLPLTKALVEANRARFHISSSPGQGTMVEITFPSTRVLAD